MRTTIDTGLRRAFVAAGGVTKLAKALGIARTAPYQWQQVPTRHIVEIEQITGVPREQLRPDLYLLSPQRRAR